MPNLITHYVREFNTTKLLLFLIVKRLNEWIGLRFRIITATATLYRVTNYILSGKQMLRASVSLFRRESYFL